MLFDDTIANNIAYGLPDATPQADRRGGARGARARIHPALPDGYETRIGERGQRLSGGQRQRLAIARALLKNSPILILDEATSSLDAESELLVQDALANLMRNRTAFVIAHRLSTVRRADAIVALERGRVAEIGRHDELLADRPACTRSSTRCRLFGRESQRPRNLASPEHPSMIKSMTGFASLTREGDTATVTVTRQGREPPFSRLQLRAPSALAAIESRLRALVQQDSRAAASNWRSRCNRGRQPVMEVEVNDAVVEALSAALDRARERGLVAGRSRRVTCCDSRRRSASASGLRPPTDDGAFAALVEAAVADALEELDRMRAQRRGASARRSRRAARAARRLVRTRPRRRPLKAPRLCARGCRAGEGAAGRHAVDETAVAQEIVRFANRSDITEETVRFRAHLEHWRALSDVPSPAAASSTSCCRR